LKSVKDVTIEAASDKVVWKSSGKSKFTIGVTNSTNVKIRGFTFDGADKLDHIMVIGGNCGGLILENLTLRGFKEDAIRFVGCAGTADDPVILRTLHVIGRGQSSAAFKFSSIRDRTGEIVNKHIHVLECSFQGRASPTFPFSGVEAVKDRVF